ncbi:hypothetical protein [Flavihumibacter solisilvae]|uniref:hypothetical protein n=1 Tax=Flavihumibacter solisilvae TaxID=1349421 RepID=UPI000AF578DA|nr:hypothetical protein [Flavihumibacter solisilvae]
MAKANGKPKATNGTPGKFSGKISLDIRDSKPDWPSFLEKKAPEISPNVLVILKRKWQQ